MKKVYYYMIEHAYILIYVIVAIAVVFLNKVYYMHGADIMFHRARLLGLVQSIKHGDILPKINFAMCNGHGYGVPMFYGQWWMYFPAVLMLAGMRFTGAWICTIVCVYTIFSVINHKIAISFGNGKKMAVIITLTFMYNPLVAQIICGDIPFAICIFMTPLLFWCFYRILYQDKRNPIWLAVIVAVLIQTHIVSTVMLAIMSGLFLLFHIRELTKKIWICFVKSLGIAIGLSAGFVFPMLEQMTEQKLHGTATGVSFRWHQIPTLSEIIQNSFADKQASIAAYPQLSLVGIILLIIGFAYYKQESEYEHRLIWLSIVLICMTSSIFPWYIFGNTLLGIVQFVGRYLVMAMAVLMLFYMCMKKKNSLFAVFLLCLTFSSLIVNCSSPDLDDEQSRYKFAQGITKQEGYNYLCSLNNDITDIIDGTKQIDEISGGEYINALVDKGVLAQNASMNPYSDTVVITDVKHSYNGVAFSYDGSGKIDVPYLWYKGYQVSYSDGVYGGETFVDEAENGFVAIEVNGRGHAVIRYKWTPLQIVTLIITIVSTLGVIVYLIVIANRSRKQLLLDK